MSYWKKLNVKLAAGEQSCVVEVRNANKTETGEHKVKVDSLMVSLDPQAFVDGYF